MNIYKTTTIGERETIVSLEIDSEKKTDVEFAKELLNVAPNEPLTTTQKFDDINIQQLLNELKNTKAILFNDKDVKPIIEKIHIVK